MTWPAKKNESKKGYVEIKGFFHYGTHLKCAGTVTFILLTKSSVTCNVPVQ